MDADTWVKHVLQEKLAHSGFLHTDIEWGFQTFRYYSNGSSRPADFVVDLDKDLVKFGIVIGQVGRRTNRETLHTPDWCGLLPGRPD